MISYLLGLSAASLTSTLALGLVLWYFDPSTTGDTGLFLFLFTLLAAITSIGALLGFYIRYRRKAVDEDTIWVALRQSGMVAVVIAGFVALQIFRVFHWWYIPIALLLILLVELYLKVKVE